MLLFFTLLSCTANKNQNNLVIVTPPSIETALLEYVHFLDRSDVVLEVGGSCPSGGIEIIYAEEQGECFEISYTDDCIQVTGGLLGTQYGLSEVLEKAGFGFFNPYSILSPEQIVLPKDPLAV
jgi:hypothetical protein